MSGARFEIYEAADGFRFRLVAGNGEVVAQGEAYSRKRDVRRAIKALRVLLWRAPVVEV